MLELPITLRAPRIDEIPNLPKVLENINAREKANIVEGFILTQNETKDFPFKFYAEINVNNSRLWKLVILLSEQLPEIVSCIYNFYDNEPKYSKYIKKTTVLKLLKEYELELTQDCNIEFGLIFQTDEELIEMFVSETKYIKFWGIDEDEFRKIMEKYNLFEIQNLNFADEYPKVIEPLKMFNEKAKDTFEVISNLTEKFERQIVE